MENSLLKIIDLIKKTGDNCIVLDSEGNPAFVVMTFDRYEKFSGGGQAPSGAHEEEMLNKFNSDIANWQASNQDKADDEWPAKQGENKGKNSATETVNLSENSLNQEKNIIDGANKDTNYYFEPVD